MRNLLVISALFPPSGGIGVQRIVKLIKYIAPMGCNITVLTVPEDSTKMKKDNSMFKDIPPGIKILRPFFYDYRKIIPGEVAKLFKPFERKYLFPDRFRIWNRFCLKNIEKLLSVDTFDAVLVNCPPFSGIELAAKIKKRFGLKVFVNLRDPFSFNNYYILKDQKEKQAKAAIIERETFEVIDGIITVTPSHLNAYTALYPDLKEKFSMVTNGFDTDDFDISRENETERSFFKIGYSGSFSSLVPLEPLLEAVYALNTEKATDIKFSISTNIPEKKVISLHKKCFEQGYAEFKGFLPHKESITNLSSCHLLLLSFKNSPATEGSYPGKVFEYFKTGRPILLMNNHTSDLANLIKNTKTGMCVNIEDQNEIRNAILFYYDQWRSDGKISYDPDLDMVKNFEYPGLAGQMYKILNCGV
jgi:glycosyltransferase involved in cell wall biosynthesis